LLEEEENCSSQDTSCPLKEEEKLQQSIEVIPKEFKN
jgi:hypothetical protein